MNRKTSKTKAALLALFAGALSAPALAQDFEAHVVRNPDETVTYTIDLDGPVSSGYIFSAAFGLDAYALWLDPFGIKIWDWVYFTQASDTFNDLVVTPAADFAFVGETDFWGFNSFGMTLTRVDPLGNIIWSKAYQSTPFVGGVASGSPERGNDLDTTADGGFILSSRIQGQPLAFQAPVLTKVDPFGNVQWANYYTDGALTQGTFASFNDVKEVLVPGVPPFYVAAGYLTDVTGSPRDPLVAAFDNLGNQMWARTYGSPNLWDQALGLEITANNDIIVVGEVQTAAGMDTTVMRLDPAGNSLWQHRYMDLQTDGSIRETPSGQLALAGTVRDPNNAQDAALLLLDPAGLPLWGQAYGGAQQDFGVAVDNRAGGNGFVLGANSRSFAPDLDIYMLGTDPAGKTGCERPFDQPFEPFTPLVTERDLIPFPIPEQTTHPLDQRDGFDVEPLCNPNPCPTCAWEFAPPVAVGDFSDIVAFLGLFGASDPCADLAPPAGVWDFSDVVAFLTSFAAGCP